VSASASTSQTENRLAGESSPYLLLHRHNPVDWYPWGEEALARAREEDRPIFLSVGYSTCYWCHVMERESFSDPAIAERMNRSFVNVKVDREERPDLDEIYMTATQILTGQGGWPNSVFLTPDLKPFYAGTYFPPDDRYGRPGFPTLLAGLADAWERRRDEVAQQAEELARAMRRFLEERVEPGEGPPSPRAARAALAGLAGRFDAEHGGFGGAPKFPTPSNLSLLLELAGEEPRAGEMLSATLDAMARGGIYDQLAGGFHRYATDRAWLVPHFEKMLYDNGLLLELYAREHARTGDPEPGRVARATAAFLAREMTTPEGAFASAIDAETAGREGAYYVWTRHELEQVLGEEGFAFLAPIYGFAGPPTFEGEAYVLHLPEPLAAAAARRRTSREELLAEIAPLRERLLAARDERPRLLTDDKVLADWNGTAIAGLATAGRLLGEPEMVERAERAAELVLREMRGTAGLLHVWRGGEARVPAMLADYAFLVHGLLALDRATGDGRWLERAVELTAEQIDRLADPRGGFYVAAESDDLLLRSKDLFDGALPSANAVAALNLLALAERTGEPRWRREAERTMAAAAPLVEQFPDGAKTMAIAALRWHGEGVPGGERDAGAHGAAPDAGAEGVAGRTTAVRDGAAELAREADEAVAVAAELGPAGGGGWRPVRLTLRCASGWHVNPPEPADETLIPTTLEAEGGELRALAWPAPETVELGGRPLAVYQGEIVVEGELLPSGDSDPTLLLRYQPCDETRCLPPATRRVRC